MGLLDALGLGGMRRLKDPVRGRAQVVGCSMPPHATHGTLISTLVVEADGVPATPVKHKCMAPVGKWPSVGERLPVTVDRANPERLRIEWDEVRSASEESWERAERIAGTGGGSAGQGLDDQGFVVASSSTTIDLTDGMSADERAKLEAFGIDADRLASGTDAIRAAMGFMNMEQGASGGPAGGAGGERDLAAELERLASLHADGKLTDAEFAAAKARLLGA